jgi:hypothetical protein
MTLEFHDFVDIHDVLDFHDFLDIHDVLDFYDFPFASSF